MKLLALLALLIALHPIQAQTVQVIPGACGIGSHTAEGPLDSDLTKRESRFFCDVAVITHFEDSHVLISFAQHDAVHSPNLAFSGNLNDGIGMRVENVYLNSGQATVVSDGSCQLFMTNGRITGIGCGMKADETGRRTVAIVTFHSAK